MTVRMESIIESFQFTIATEMKKQSSKNNVASIIFPIDHMYYILQHISIKENRFSSHSYPKYMNGSSAKIFNSAFLGA